MRFSLALRVMLPPLQVSTVVVAAPALCGSTTADDKALALARITAPRTAVAYLKPTESPSYDVDERNISIA
jgi:hypothetical protein